METRSAYITVRIDTDAKAYLAMSADKMHWTLSTITNVIIRQWIESIESGEKTLYDLIGGMGKNANNK